MASLVASYVIVCHLLKPARKIAHSPVSKTFQGVEKVDTPVRGCRFLC
jgi:hypothetical protein